MAERVEWAIHSASLRPDSFLMLTILNMLNCILHVDLIEIQKLSVELRLAIVKMIHSNLISRKNT